MDSGHELVMSCRVAQNRERAGPTPWGLHGPDALLPSEKPLLGLGSGVGAAAVRAGGALTAAVLAPWHSPRRGPGSQWLPQAQDGHSSRGG